MGDIMDYRLTYDLMEVLLDTEIDSLDMRSIALARRICIDKIFDTINAKDAARKAGDTVELEYLTDHLTMLTLVREQLHRAELALIREITL